MAPKTDSFLRVMVSVESDEALLVSGDRVIGPVISGDSRTPAVAIAESAIRLAQAETPLWMQSYESVAEAQINAHAFLVVCRAVAHSAGLPFEPRAMKQGQDTDMISLLGADFGDAAFRGEAIAYLGAVRTVAAQHGITARMAAAHLRNHSAEGDTIAARLALALASSPGQSVRAVGVLDGIDVATAREAIGANPSLFAIWCRLKAERPEESESALVRATYADTGIPIPHYGDDCKVSDYEPEVREAFSAACAVPLPNLEGEVLPPAWARLRQWATVSLGESHLAHRADLARSFTEVVREFGRSRKEPFSLNDFCAACPGGNAQRDWPVLVESWRRLAGGRGKVCRSDALGQGYRISMRAHPALPVAGAQQLVAVPVSAEPSPLPVKIPRMVGRRI